MKLFKLFALSLVALPSVALGMESAESSFDRAAFEALLKNKGDHNVRLCDAQVKYFRGIQSRITEYKPSTKYMGPSFSLKDGTKILATYCTSDTSYKCVVVQCSRVGGKNLSPCPYHSKGSSFVTALKFSSIGLLAAAAITGTIYKQQILHFVSDSEYAREQMYKFSRHHPNLASLAYWAKDISSPIWTRLASLFRR